MFLYQFCPDIVNMTTFPKNDVEQQIEDKVFEGNVEDYDATYTLVKKLLKTVGLRMTTNDSQIKSSLWNAYFWFTFLNIVVSITLELVSMFVTDNGGTFLEIAAMIPCVGYLIVALAKSYKMKIYRSVYENLIYELRDMWPNGKIPEDEHKIITASLSRLRFLSRAYFVCNIMLGSIFILLILIKYVKRALGFDDNDDPLVLPFSYWLPFELEQDTTYRYEAVLAFQSFHCFMAILSMLSGDLLFCIFLNHITTQFTLLSLRIDKLFHVPIDDQLVVTYPLGMYSKLRNIEEDTVPSENGDSQTSVEEKLGSIILRHKALIRLSDDVENLYTFSLLVNFMNSSLIICFCLFCVTFVEKWNEFIYKIFFSTAISQIWILCWYGQRLIDTSSGVGEALYNSGWYIASHKLKKSILIMIHRSQKHVHVTTYGFSIISLESYASILKTSWSYFTLLINMNTDDE